MLADRQEAQKRISKTFVLVQENLGVKVMKTRWEKSKSCCMTELPTVYIQREEIHSAVLAGQGGRREAKATGGASTLKVLQTQTPSFFLGAFLVFIHTPLHILLPNFCFLGWSTLHFLLDAETLHHSISSPYYHFEFCKNLLYYIICLVLTHPAVHSYPDGKQDRSFSSDSY